MAYRPAWQGHLRLSLVTCPVALYTATNSGGDVRFNLINPATHNRIKMVTTDPETGPVDRSSLVKGYAVAKDEYILVTDEEIQSVKLDSTKTIDIERFVPEDEIDRLYWDSPYYLAPAGAIAEEAFAVIREAMRSEGKIALGRVVLSTRERLLALEPRDKGILAYSLRTRGEVRSARDVFGAISDIQPDPAMIEIARRIIEQQAGPFEPDQFVDRYEEALKALIASKQKGRKPVRVAEPEATEAADLMSALRASLQGPPGRSSRARPGGRAAAGAKPARAAPRRRAG